MQFTCVHAIQYSLNSCLLLLPCRSEGAPCVDWLCANVKTTVESVFVVHAVLSALLQVEHSDPILFHSFFLACEKRNKRNIRCDCSSAPQSYHLQNPRIQHGLRGTSGQGQHFYCMASDAKQSRSTGSQTFQAPNA